MMNKRATEAMELLREQVIEECAKVIENLTIQVRMDAITSRGLEQLGRIVAEQYVTAVRALLAQRTEEPKAAQLKYPNDWQTKIPSATPDKWLPDSVSGDIESMSDRDKRLAAAPDSGGMPEDIVPFLCEQGMVVWQNDYDRLYAYALSLREKGGK